MPSHFLSRTLRHKYEDRPGDKEGGECRPFRGLKERREWMVEKRKRRWTIPILLPQSRKGRSVTGRNCSLRSGLLALALLPVFDTTSPGKGGGWNRAGARHGSFTPPRFSRSCVQEYHCKLTGSWRSSLPKLHLTWVGIALHLLLAVLICGECSAQVVLAHPV